MKRSKVYKFTGRAAKFSWGKITIRQAVFEALKELKCADVPKIIGTVLKKHPDYHTKQRDPDKQIRFTLWQFTREGIAREQPDRRWRPQANVVAMLRTPTKRKRKVG
jgi:uncharacterized protein (UPF0297 family)